MSKLRREPIGHTCPDIDRVISTMTSIIKEMDGCKGSDEVVDLLSQISSWSSDLANIAIGRWSEIEDLRSSNSALRDWGKDMYSYAEELENEINELNSTISELNDKVDDLRDEL